MKEKQRTSVSPQPGRSETRIPVQGWNDNPREAERVEWDPKAREMTDALQ